MKPRWPRFRLRTLLLLLLAAAIAAAWVGYELRKPETPDAFLIANVMKEAARSPDATDFLNRLGYIADRGIHIPLKDLVFHSRYRTVSGEKRTVFVYRPNQITFPGNNADVVAIADERHRLVAWEDVGVESVFNSAELTRDKSGDSSLVVTRGHRVNSIGLSRWILSLADDKIDLVDIEWRGSDGKRPPPDDGYQWSRDMIRARALGEPTDHLLEAMPTISF